MSKKNRLIREREANPVNISKLIRYLAGGDKNYELYQLAFREVMSRPELYEQDYNFYDRSRSEQRKRALEMIVAFRKLADEIRDPEFLTAIFRVMASMSASFGVRYGVHLGLFGGAIQGQGSPEQIAEYWPRVQDMSIYGCFCMTELGTGSYLQSFETTATFDHARDEFVIHSPTLTSTKWWIGAAAQSATHGIVFAKLILNGEDLGTHNFIVQLRDENFDLLPGITVGDVGPKRGDDGIDNGWVRFNQVRIPRTQMLSKWSRVNAQGQYEKSELPQLAYGALIAGRVMISRGVTDSVKKAVTIATRYCTVRDQHSMEGKCLLDYTVQQERLIGGMAAAYAFHFATDRLTKKYEKVTAELLNKDISNLKDLHNMSAGIKGFAALWANDAINQCIFSMGGHGYSKLSALPTILADFAPSIPYEGDAILLAQQTASYLVKSLGALMQGKEIKGDSITYLNNLPAMDGLKLSPAVEGDLTLSQMRDAAQWLAMFLIKDAAMDLHKEVMDLGNQDEAWNSCQLKLIQASRAHIMYLVIDSFQDTLVNELPKALGDTASHMIPLLTQVGELFALRHMQEFLAHFLENGYLPHGRGQLMRQQILDLYASLRPFANQLVDAWDIKDVVLGTPLGRHDGEVYENYFKAVNEGPQDIKPDYWEELLKPFFKKNHARLES